YAGDQTFQEKEVHKDDKFKNVYRLCGSPTVVHTSNDISISIYTDIETQFKLAKLKNAFWFRPGYYGEGGYTSNGVELYNAIKDENWPEIKSIHDLPGLDQSIKDELINVYNYPEDLGNVYEAICTKIDRLEKVISNNCLVYKPVKIINDNCDCTFHLSDVCNTEFKCVTDALGLEHTQELADHVNNWVSLHPQNIQDIIRTKIVQNM
ncbi:MAG: hypothetical protein DRI24_23515, partial [Deltaproteobacteria bacterium]